jgi:hypothetical protein
MATATKFVKPISIVLAYLFQLDMDVVPIKMTCEVVSLSIIFFKMAVVAMETNKILKN